MYGEVRSMNPSKAYGRFVQANTVAELEVADGWMDEALRLLVPKLYQAPGAIHLMVSLLPPAPIRI